MHIKLISHGITIFFLFFFGAAAIVNKKNCFLPKIVDARFIFQFNETDGLPCCGKTNVKLLVIGVRTILFLLLKMQTEFR